MHIKTITFTAAHYRRMMSPRPKLIAVVLLLPLSSRGLSPGCRCVPADPCWPSPQDWQSLNDSVSGRLSVPTSPVEPCLNNGGDKENEEECRKALENFGKDPYWLQSLPGGSESTGKIIVG